MNEKSEPHREEATGIVERLLGSDRQGLREQEEDIQVREGLYIGDVREEARQFRDHYSFFRAFDLPFPALRFGDGGMCQS